MAEECNVCSYRDWFRSSLSKEQQILKHLANDFRCTSACLYIGLCMYVCLSVLSVCIYACLYVCVMFVRLSICMSVQRHSEGVQRVYAYMSPTFPPGAKGRGAE